MLACLDRAFAARSAVVVASCLAIAGLSQAAVAGDSPGLRLEDFLPFQIFAPAPVAAPAAIAPEVHHRAPRRIWATSRSRPLRITLARKAHRTHLVRQRRARMPVGAASAPHPLVLPKPERPALVSIYQDRTLRNGDAVMMADGIHLFRSAAAWPHRPGEFVRLRLVASLGWSLRRSFSDLDRAPPSPWADGGTTAG